MLRQFQPGRGYLVLRWAALGVTFSSSVSAWWRPLALLLVPPQTLILLRLLLPLSLPLRLKALPRLL
jgi:hypothetical protein